MANYPTEFEEAESGLKKFAFLSILRTVWKRRARITLAWALFATGAVIVVRRLPSVYQAEALVQIDSQKIPEKFVSAAVASDLEERITSIRQLLLSGGELKKIIEEFGLYTEERKTHFEEDILDMMRQDISITLDLGGPTGNANTKKTQRPGAFRVAYQGSNPTVVTHVTNRLADLYVEQNLKTREGQAAGTSDFLDTQLREAKKHLDEMEQQVSAYKVQHNGELPEQERVLSATLGRLQTELEANRDATNRAQQAKVTLESSIMALESNLAAEVRGWQQTQRPDDAADTVAAPGTPADAPKSSAALELQLAQLRARVTENHPDVIKLRSELENVKRIEAQRQASAAAAPSASEPASTAASNRKPPQGEPREIAQSRGQLATLRAQLKGTETELANRDAEQRRILRDIASYQSRVERLPLREQDMAQLTRDYEVSKDNYKSLLDKKMAAGMSLDMERRQQSERFVVLDRAQVPEKPFKPQRPKLYAAGVGASLVVALLLGFTAELRRNVLLGEWELPPDAPILARLPYIEVTVQQHSTKSPSRGWFSRKKEPSGGGAVALRSALDRL